MTGVVILVCLRTKTYLPHTAASRLSPLSRLVCNKLLFIHDATLVVLGECPLKLPDFSVVLCSLLSLLQASLQIWVIVKRGIVIYIITTSLLELVDKYK